MPGSRFWSKRVVLNLFLQTGSPLGSMAQLLPILLIFGIFYFLLFLPMQRQRKQQQKMLAGLQKGNVVVTSGGLVGTNFALDGGDTPGIRVQPGKAKLQGAPGSGFSPVPSA